MLFIIIIVVLLLIGLDTVAIVAVRRTGRMDKLAFAEITAHVEDGERVLFKGSLSKMLLGFWPYVPVSGALAVTNRRVLWQQGEGVPVPFLLRTSLEIALADIENVSNPAKVNPDMVQLTVDGNVIRFFLNSLAGPKFTAENQRKPKALMDALHTAMAGVK